MPRPRPRHSQDTKNVKLPFGGVCTWPPTACHWCGCVDVRVIDETYDDRDDVVAGFAVCTADDNHRHLYLRPATSTDRGDPRRGQLPLTLEDGAP